MIDKGDGGHCALHNDRDHASVHLRCRVLLSSVVARPRVKIFTTSGAHERGISAV